MSDTAAMGNDHHGGHDEASSSPNPARPSSSHHQQQHHQHAVVAADQSLANDSFDDFLMGRISASRPSAAAAAFTANAVATTAAAESVGGDASSRSTGADYGLESAAPPFREEAEERPRPVNTGRVAAGTTTRERGGVQDGVAVSSNGAAAAPFAVAPPPLQQHRPRESVIGHSVSNAKKVADVLIGKACEGIAATAAIARHDADVAAGDVVAITTNTIPNNHSNTARRRGLAATGEGGGGAALSRSRSDTATTVISIEKSELGYSTTSSSDSSSSEDEGCAGGGREGSHASIFNSNSSAASSAMLGNAHSLNHRRRRRLLPCPSSAVVAKMRSGERTMTYLYHEDHYLRDQQGRAYRLRKLAAVHHEEGQDDDGDDNGSTAAGRGSSSAGGYGATTKASSSLSQGNSSISSLGVGGSNDAASHQQPHRRSPAAAAAGNTLPTPVTKGSSPATGNLSPPAAPHANGGEGDHHHQHHAGDGTANGGTSSSSPPSSPPSTDHIKELPTIFVGTDKDRFDTVRAMARYPFIERIPLLGPLANTFGLFAALTLGICYFLGKGLGSHMVASGALPLFKDVFKVSSTQYQAFTTLLDLGWSSKPIVGLLSDLVLLRGSHKRGWLLVAVVMIALCSIVFVLLPSPPKTATAVESSSSSSSSSSDAAFYASMASLAAICGFFISFGFATVDLLLEGFYCELMQLCPPKSSMLVSWVWLMIMSGGIVAAALEGPIADYWNPKVCLVISGISGLLLGIPIARNWFGEQRFVRFPRLDSGAAGLSGAHGRSGEGSASTPPPSAPPSSSHAGAGSGEVFAPSPPNPPSATAAPAAAAVTVAEDNIVLVEFATVDDAHSFAMIGGGSGVGRRRGDATAGDDAGDDDTHPMHEREGLLGASGGVAARTRRKKDRRRSSVLFASELDTAARDGGGGDGGINSPSSSSIYKRKQIDACVALCGAGPCIAAESAVGAAFASSSFGGGPSYLSPERRGSGVTASSSSYFFGGTSGGGPPSSAASLPFSSTFMFLSSKARQHKPIVLYAALMGATSIAMALSTISFSTSSSGDDSSGSGGGGMSAADKDAQILRGRLQLLGVAASAITILSVASFFCLPKMIASANLFMCLKELLYVRIGGPMDYFYTAEPQCLVNGPHFSYSYYQSFTAIVGYAAGAVGVSIFYRFFSRQSIRKTFFITTAIKITASIIDLILVNRWNVTYFANILPFPLSTIFSHDKSVYFFGDAIIFQAVQMMDFMPMVLLTSKMCPKGLECTTYAILAGFSNFGGVLSNTVGSLLIAFVFPIRTSKPSDWVSVSPSSSSAVGSSSVTLDAAALAANPKYPNGYCDFSNLSTLLMIAHFLLPLATLVLIPILLPNHKMDEEVLGGDGGGGDCGRDAAEGGGGRSATENSTVNGGTAVSPSEQR